MFSGDNTTGQLTFNNTGHASYSNVGAGSCVDNWSYIQWDITGYDGNVLYGLKTVYIKIFLSNGNYGPIQDFINRSVVYKEQQRLPQVPRLLLHHININSTS